MVYPFLWHLHTMFISAPKGLRYHTKGYDVSELCVPNVMLFYRFYGFPTDDKRGEAGC